MYRTLIPVAVTLAVAAPAGARTHHRAPRHHPAPVTWTDFRDHPKGYLAAGDLPDAYAFLPPPPSPDSPRGKADVAIYQAMKALKGTPRWAGARADADVETPAAPHTFSCAAGVEIGPKTTPVLSLLLARVMSDVGKAEDRAKDTYARPRPFLADDGDICVPKDAWLVKQGSYPSGHAATGMAWALVLSELKPDHEAALVRRGVRFGESRLVCRVHFASDVEAGRLVGAAVVARLHRSAGFLTDMRRARAELAAAHTSAPAMGCAASDANVSPAP